MEGLTRLVAESLARHGFDRPVDYRRLHWSRWFRCESVHSLLFVPSKPGVFALAEEIMDFGPSVAADPGLGMPRPANGPAMPNPAVPMWGQPPSAVRPSEARLPFAASTTAPARRMLAVTQFFEDDDMAFVLDRMLSRKNPMHDRLATGRYFVRFVVIEDQAQRHGICNALNQWMASSAEKATGIGAHFATSLELTPATEYVPQAHESQANLFANASVENASVGNARVGAGDSPAQAGTTNAHAESTFLSANLTATYPKPSGEAALKPAAPTLAPPHLDSGAAANIHCPSPFPAGF